MKYDVLIIGGGAAGLAAACALSRPGRRVALLEKQDRVGRKLLSTGNGRCNLTNFQARAEHFHGARPAARRALELCPPKRVASFFESLGVPVVADTEGRAYPMSNQAASVLDALRLFASEHGCEIIVNAGAESLNPGKGGFEVRAMDGHIYRAGRVIVCTGGLAAPKLGACGDGYRMLEALGHRSNAKFPAIAALKTPPEAVRALKGQRAAGTISLLCEGRALRTERGEILFSDAGVSGIAAMQLARACGEAQRAQKRCELSIDFLPDAPDGAEFIARRAKLLPARTMEDFLNGAVSRRIGMTLAKAAGIEPLNRTADSLSSRERQALGAVLKGWTLPVTGVLGFDQAQVTAGGIDLKDFDWDSFESRRIPGLYAAGEVLDVDGDCGGFNLQWAWSTALIASDAILREWAQEN